MSEFYSQHWEIATAFIVMLITSIGFLIKQIVGNTESKEKKVEKRIDKLEAEVEHQKTNYSVKFDAVHTKIESKFEEMMTKLNEIQLTNKDAYHSFNLKLDRQITVCEMVQKAKKQIENK